MSSEDSVRCAFCDAPSIIVAAVGCGETVTPLPRCSRHERTCEQCRFEPMADEEHE